MLNKLIRGNRYTLIGNDGFLDFNMKITLVDFMYKQYAQYEDVPVIVFKKKGGRNLHTMYLSYEYSFLNGWQDINNKKIIKNTNLVTVYQHLKYKDLTLNDITLSGKVGQIKVNKNYESLIDHSSNLIVENGLNSEKYKIKLKEFFTEFNYSFNDEMIDYYKQNHDYFISILENNLTLANN